MAKNETVKESQIAQRMKPIAPFHFAAFLLNGLLCPPVAELNGCPAAGTYSTDCRNYRQPLKHGQEFS